MSSPEGAQEVNGDRAPQEKVNDPVDGPEVETPAQKAPDFLYKLEWEDENTNVRQNFSSRSTFAPLDVPTEHVDHQEIATAGNEVLLEVVTPIWGPSSIDFRATSKKQKKQKEKQKSNLRLEDIKITRVGKTRLIIRSPNLINIIRKCAAYFPNQPLAESEVILHEPYPILVHHLDKLEEARRELETR